MDDPFIRGYDPSELEIAAEFLTTWLPFLSRGLCDPCAAELRRRVLSLRPGSSGGAKPSDRIAPMAWDSESPKARMSWADMAQEDELEEEEEEEAADAGKKRAEEAEVEGEEKGKGRKKPELSREQREQIRFKNVGRKKEFLCLERIHGRLVNILAGLELHTGVFSAAEQKRIVDFVYELQEKGRNGQFGGRTYSEPDKWMRGKGRVTIQFGCCYNYAKDKEGNLPGILRHVVADPIPDLFKVIIKRLIRWHVLPPTCIPDSCIVNIYEPGDCIPPHIDSHDFVRPFCTVSFLSECNILFGSNLKVAGPGEFAGSFAIPLPVGSVLVMNGNGADLAKHCVPAVPTKRISITFRKMDETRRPVEFIPEPDLQNIVPLPYDSGANESPPHGGKGTTSAVQDRREGKNYKARRSRGRSGPRRDQRFQESQPALHDQIAPTDRSPLPRMDGQRAMTGDTAERGRDLAEKSIESESKSDSQGTQLHRSGGDGHMKWSTQGRRFEEGTGSMEDNRQYGERRVQIDQRNIVVSRNLNQGEQAENRSFDPTAFSGIHVRTLYNARRRGRV